MKKGCFITAIAVTTIIIGAALYIFQNHFDSLVLKPGKKIIAGFVKDELREKLKFVKDSKEKMELKELVKKYSENPKVLEQFNQEDLEQLISEIKYAITDSVITKSELEKIKQIIESKLK